MMFEIASVFFFGGGWGGAVRGGVGKCGLQILSLGDFYQSISVGE